MIKGQPVDFFKSFTARQTSANGSAPATSLATMTNVYPSGDVNDTVSGLSDNLSLAYDACFTFNNAFDEFILMCCTHKLKR